MGQQQLLLLVAGTIVVALMVAVGIVLFKDHASATNRDALANDLVHYASKSQEYYRRPTLLAGGNGSFVGFQLEGTHANANGSYSLSGVTASTLNIEGLGVEIGYDMTNPVKVVIQVTADSVKVKEVN